VESPVPKEAGANSRRWKDHTVAVAVARDWWWPWWISSLFDVGVVVVAVIVFVRANRRLVRQVAVVVGIGAIVAAGLAPVVMKGKASDSPMRMQTGDMMTTP
jgi:hypothetical protein